MRIFEHVEDEEGFSGAVESHLVSQKRDDDDDDDASIDKNVLKNRARKIARSIQRCCTRGRQVAPTRSAAWVWRGKRDKKGGVNDDDADCGWRRGVGGNTLATTTWLRHQYITLRPHWTWQAT